MLRPANLTLLLLLGLGTVTAGCSGGKAEGPAVVNAAGKVTLEGAPLEGARLFFIPAGDGGVDCGAVSSADGSFTASTGGRPGAAPGSYKVIVQHYSKKDGSPFTLSQADVEAGMDMDQQIAMGAVKLTIPQRYQMPDMSGLTATVPPEGTDGLVIELKKK